MPSKQKALTPEMESLLSLITEHGSIYRYEGGFWAKPNAHMNIHKKQFSDEIDYIWPDAPSFGAGTIKALVSRNLIEPIGWTVGMYGLYPNEYAIKK